MSAPAPLVTIVMAARNAQATLAQAIDSIVAQDATDWELIVVDDGSADATPAMLARYAAADPRIRLLAGPGEGAAQARNRGIAEGRGQWLAFLDSDDWWDGDFLSTMLAALDGQPAGSIAYCGYRRVMPDGAMAPPRVDPRVAQAPFAAFALPCPVTIHTLLIELAQVRRAGGFDTSLTTCEDWDLWQRLSRAGASWIMVDRPLAYYRASAGSLTRASRQMMRDGQIVLKRAYGPDPRVPEALPAFAAGLAVNKEGQDFDQVYAWFTLWNMVVAHLDGDTQAPDPALLAPLTRSSDWTNAIAASIIDATVVGLRITAEQQAAQWDRLAPTARWTIAAIAQAWGDPAAAIRLTYALEEQLLRASFADPAPCPLDRTMRLHLPIEAPGHTTLPDGIDRILAVFTDRGRPIGIRMVGALGDLGPRDWHRLIRMTLPFGRMARGALRSRPVNTALRAGRSLARQMLREPRRLTSRPGLRSAARTALGDALHGQGQQGALSPHQQAALRLRADAAQQAAALSVAAVAAPRLAAPPEEERSDDRQGFWERYFETEDPWNYGSPYEQEKYARQAALLPDGPIGRALELACAEGFFTAYLAPRVERLIVTDISAKAVERARARNAAHSHIDWQTLDLSADPIPQDMDLIVCSEVLYYLSGVDELAQVAARLADALAPGGAILSAHAYVLTDDPSRTGFDWGNPYGAARIAQTFAATPGLTLEASVETELYRIDRFRKGAPVAAPTVTPMTVDAPVEDAVARAIVWNGAVLRRSEALAGQRTDRLPILMYHGVAEDGPATLARWRHRPDQFRDQIRWLRSHGYHGLTGDQVLWHLTTRTPFWGRPVWITFDDGYQDFADIAWPILRAHDFPAEMFLVTGALGGTAAWDTPPGDPAAAMPALMDADAIVRLAAEGVHFGSHLHSHPAADTLASIDLARELAQSSAIVERLTGQPTLGFAAPFMAGDPRLPAMAADFGYALGFVDRFGCATLADAPRDLPRMEVRGDMTLDQFAAMMEATRA